MRLVLQRIGGVNLDETHPGFKKFTIRPQICKDIDWVKCSHESPYGIIKSEWCREDEDFVLKVTIPENTSSDIDLRFINREQSVINVCSGEHEFRTRLG